MATSIASRSLGNQPGNIDMPQLSAARDAVLTIAQGRFAMKAKDVMTRDVLTVRQDASILDAAQSMLQRKISGLQVVDAAGNLAGIVTEGDFLRRAETQTQRRRPRWIEIFVSPGRLADDYVHGSGRKIHEVMTPEVWPAGRPMSAVTPIAFRSLHRSEMT
jgi:CBS-domain-containing membrane protein